MQKLCFTQPVVRIYSNSSHSQSTCPRHYKITSCKSNDTTPETTSNNGRRRLSAESRAKISAALKGRRKSAEHRENLRRRFGGDQNPMYGRKLSAETRAKISRSMSARRRGKKVVDEEEKSKESEELEVKNMSVNVLKELKEKVENSRLIQSTALPQLKRKRRTKKQILKDKQEEENLEQLLKNVEELHTPPEAVIKAIAGSERKRKVKENMSEETGKCEKCNGSGMTSCVDCVGAFGVISSRCETCFGVGSVYCESCQGVGQQSV